MVTVEVPEDGPMTVNMDGRRRLRVTTPSDAPKVARGQTRAGPSPPASQKRTARSRARPRSDPAAANSPTPADEARFPRAAVAIDAVSILAATALSALLLLPLTRAKVLRQLPCAPPVVPRPLTGGRPAGVVPLLAHLAGARPAAVESGVRFGATSLVPPPLSLLIGYFASVPLQASIVRHQAGFIPAAATTATTNLAGLPRPVLRHLPKLTSPGGFARAWTTHALRDIPFTMFEAYALSKLLAALAANKRKATALTAQADPQAAASPQPPTVAPRPADAILAASFAGICTVPLDLLRTRLLVAAKPSVRRTLCAAARLIRQRGPQTLLTPGGSTLYVAECMLRPVTFLGVYAVCRAALVTGWMTWNFKKLQTPSDDRSQRKPKTVKGSQSNNRMLLFQRPF